MALILALFTFLKTGGINDIKRQIWIIRDDLTEVREQSEQRMENRSLLFEALYNLTDSIDSLQAGNGVIARELIDEAVEKMISVERKLKEHKRKQLERLREEIEECADSLRQGDMEGIREFEYRIRLLRIFEENL